MFIFQNKSLNFTKKFSKRRGRKKWFRAVCGSGPDLSQRLDAGADVAARHLRDDEVDGGGRAAVKVVKVWRDGADPWRETQER